MALPSKAIRYVRNQLEAILKDAEQISFSK